MTEAEIEAALGDLRKLTEGGIVGLWEAQEEADRSTICVTIKGRSLLNESLTSEEKRGKHKN